MISSVSTELDSYNVSNVVNTKTNINDEFILRLREQFDNDDIADPV